MKNILLLAALAVASGFVVAASAGARAAITDEASASSQGGKLTKTEDSLPLGHLRTIPADTQLVNSGKVLEVLDTEMYTYIQVTTVKGPLWLAAYKTVVAIGATVRYSNGVAMSNFHSNALDRSFDVIVFVDSLEQVK